MSVQRYDLGSTLLKAVALAALILASCARPPESYAPPAQSNIEPGPEPAPSSQFASMGSPWAEEHIVQDIEKGPTPEQYRWTNQRPKLQFEMTGPGPWKLVVNLVIAEATFRSTGPVRITFAVNDRSLGSIACNRPGPYRFEQNVPVDWLPARGPSTVSAIADRTWTSPDDGVVLGFMLIDAGLFPR